MTAIEPIRLVLVATVGFITSMAGTGLLIRYLIKRQILDRPNERSSHTIPTPRGGGIAVLGAVVAAWVTGLALSPGTLVTDGIVLTAAVGLGVVCFIDDLHGLKAMPRLVAQCVAIAPGLWFLSEDGGLFRAWLSLPLDLAVTGFLWLWFINLFNFMDGIDGITGVQIATVGIGLAGLVAGGAVAPALLEPALALTAGALGFLVWNWRPAGIFMGDVGSIPLGLLIGWLLINASHGVPGESSALAACAILPAYYLSDASITLCRRLLKRENVLQAHRQHFYQQAVIRGFGHATVCGWIILANAALILTAWFLAGPYPTGALVLASCITVVLLLQMAKARAPLPNHSEAK